MGGIGQPVRRIWLNHYAKENFVVNLAYVIAGSEATGGAGLQADLKTFQQMGVYGIGTVTCIVSFDPSGGWQHRFHPIPPEVIGQQIEAATAAHDLDVVKVGMLGTPATIDQVARSLRTQAWRHVVVDPVLICKGQEPGAALDTDRALRAQILPLATVVTPNNFEARVLAGMAELSGVEDLIEAGRRIVAELAGAGGGLAGPRAVVVKGGVDLPGDQAIDVLVEADPDSGTVTHQVFSAPKIGQARVSGAGCTFAAAITAALAQGAAMSDAVATAKRYVTQGIAARVHAHTPFDTVWQGAFS
ncbi:MAG: bifunctional hydroxymethylpyrimidine kinase/phosphomethylpyrimidine kinase [Bifidobacteriaceae bacterium]|jgi:pyridoxine kinase|nr:bifunctional hydroxymethylpyrimidine kinase/phosphomethylpyrimidine kinase [Bifidobacteriaceae bacterium]